MYHPLNEEIEVNLIEDEEAREKAKTIGYYAMFEYTNGFKKTLYWSKSKKMCIRDRDCSASLRMYIFLKNFPQYLWFFCIQTIYRINI